MELIILMSAALLTININQQGHWMGLLWRTDQSRHPFYAVLLVAVPILFLFLAKTHYWKKSK